MERNSETKTLSYSKGMTNVPSDLLSGDDELQESVGFIYKDGEMKPIQKAVNIGQVKDKIVYIHKGSDYENIITDKDGYLAWYKHEDKIIAPEGDNELIDVTGEDVYFVNSVGNTLIIQSNYDTYYFLYKNNGYQYLGTSLPKPEVYIRCRPIENFLYPNYWVNDRKRISYMDLRQIATVKKAYISYSEGKISKVEYLDANGEIQIKVLNAYAQNESTKAYSAIGVKHDKISDLNNAVQGLVAKELSVNKKRGFFSFPFSVRYALRLYDGSYTRISAPIMCYPTVRRGVKFIPIGIGGDYWFETENTEGYYTCSLPASYLEIEAMIPGISEWSDIVSDFVLFASDEVKTFDIESDWKLIYPDTLDGRLYYDTLLQEKYHAYKFDFSISKQNGEPTDTLHTSFLPDEKSDKDIRDELINKSVYYKIIETKAILFSERKTITSLAYMKNDVLTNLVEQEQLPYDDYYGWTTKVAKKSYVYNKRINIFDIRRFPFKGFNQFTAFGKIEEEIDKITYYVHISTPTMSCWVRSDEIRVDPSFLDCFFFYPDTHADKLIAVKNGQSVCLSLILERHPKLNGSYAFHELPDIQQQYLNDDLSDEEIPKVTLDAYETLDSQILTSEVNNPFVFNASGDNTVGTGKILGIVANTEAVSQGQFGQYPLMVFTNEGIYGLSVSSEGLYVASYPISREVCNDDSPLVPTDRLVFFVSKKGLMAASGGQVACMSEQMRGKVPQNFTALGSEKFLDFLKDCFIAYDYRDSLLRIFSKGKSYQYIYNMVDRTFCMVNNGIEAQSVVNDYPDNLIQDTAGNVYSLTNKPDMNDDTNTYDGTIVTRPLKLGGSLTLKSLRKIKHLVNSMQGNLSLEIWASNNAKNWCQLHSLTGKPWSYFVFRYKLTNFKANDSFTGTIVRVQNRREIKF